MDLQEFQRSINTVVGNKNSTPECVTRFERALSNLSAHDPQNMQDNLKRSVRFFESALMSITEKPGTDPVYRQKIDSLRLSLRSISKSEVNEVLLSTRNTLREHLLDLTVDQNEICKSGESALDEGNPKLLFAALQKIRQTPQPNANLALLFCKIARRLRDDNLLIEGIGLLKSHLGDPYCLRRYAFYAKNCHNREAMKTALEELGRNLSDKWNLALYAAIARFLRCKEEMLQAISLLQPACADPVCLTAYAALARTLGDTGQMEFALGLLENHLGDAHCLTTYATLARRLGNKEAMGKAQKLLASKIDDFRCLTTYAKNSTLVGTEEDPLKAMAGLKEHTDDPRILNLYLEVAESDNTK